MKYPNKAASEHNILDEIGSWPIWARIGVGLLVIPLLAYYVSTTPIALFWGRVGEFTAKSDILLIGSGALAGNLAKYIWPGSWLPFAVPPIILAIVVVWRWSHAGPLSDLVQILPFLFQIIGAPVLSVYMFAKYQRRVGLKPI